MSLGKFRGNFARILKNLPVPESQEPAQTLFPVGHGHGNLSHGLHFRHVQIGRDDPLHLPELKFGQVVLGNGDIIPVDLAAGCALPTGQPHILLLVVGTVHDDLGCGLAVDGVVHLVLHGGEETLRR